MRDFQTPVDTELTDHQLLDAERLVVEYAHENGHLLNSGEVELEDFSVVTVDECMSESEILALNKIMEDDSSFDLPFETFYTNYMTLVSTVTTESFRKYGK